MLSASKLSTKEEVDFKVTRDFKVLDLEELLSEETLCTAGLNQLPKGESRIFHFLFLAYSFLLLF